MISVTISLGDMPIDKMQKTEEGNTCPPATVDSELNEQNKQIAREEANYGDATSLEVCGNCAAFNKTQEIMDCMGGDPQLGYCQIFKFICNEDKVCDSWAEGGPIVDTDNGSDHDIL